MSKSAPRQEFSSKPSLKSKSVYQRHEDDDHISSHVKGKTSVAKKSKITRNIHSDEDEIPGPTSSTILLARKTKRHGLGRQSDSDTRSSSQKPKKRTKDTGEVTPNASRSPEKSKGKKISRTHGYETIPVRRGPRTARLYSSVSTEQADDLPLLATKQYRKGHSTLPSASSRRSPVPSATRGDDNPASGSRRPGDLFIDETRPAVSNPCYASLDSHPSSETLPKNTSANQQDDDQVKPRRQRPGLVSERSDMSSTDKAAEEKELRKRRIRAHFHWHFLYTMLNNYHLYDLRKRRKPSTVVEEQELSPTDAPLTATDVPSPPIPYAGDG